MKDLDFLVIGAQKSGTTSLFRYLVSHPQVYMPPEKEAPYFSVDERFRGGWESFARVYFKGATEAAVWGKATPQYMCDPVVPERIASTMPNTKLIAILRDPIQRAVSHYKMAVRRGLETRSFDDAIRQQLSAPALELARKLRGRWEDELHCYVVWGEYGRILSAFRERLPTSPLILFTAELESSPRLVVKRLYEHLGVSTDYVPQDLGKHYHVGGSTTRLPLREVAHRTPFLKELWGMIPSRPRERMKYWLEQWNIRPEKTASTHISPQTISALQAHFKLDGERLQQLERMNVPWSVDW